MSVSKKTLKKKKLTWLLKKKSQALTSKSVFIEGPWGRKVWCILMGFAEMTRSVRECFEIWIHWINTCHNPFCPKFAAPSQWLDEDKYKLSAEQSNSRENRYGITCGYEAVTAYESLPSNLIAQHYCMSWSCGQLDGRTKRMNNCMHIATLNIFKLLNYLKKDMVNFSFVAW